MIKTKLEVPIYDWGVEVYFCEHKDFPKQDIAKNWEEYSSSSGVCLSNTSKCEAVIYINEMLGFWSYDFWCSLTHEIYHLVERISDNVGFAYMGEEARAYLMGYLTENICRGLKKYSEKQKAKKKKAKDNKK